MLLAGSFVTNKQELQLLKTPAYKQKIAELLQMAVLKYRRSLKSTAAIALTPFKSCPPNRAQVQAGS